MGLGLIAGAMQGAGEAGVAAGAQAQKQFGQEDLLRMKAEADKDLAKTTSELAVGAHAEMANTDIANIPRKGEAETGVAVKREKALRPGEVAKRKEFADVDTQAEVDRFTKLEPLKRKAEIDTAVEKVRAMATPEMLKAVRAEALAKHIVDPSYTLVPNADGTVTTFDSHSGKSTGKLTGPDGAPIIRKDPEELKAAATVINMANTNLKIAEAAYKAVAGNLAASDEEKATTAATWKAAQAEARRIAMPAYAVLYGKMSKEGAELPAAKEAPDARTSKMDYGFVNPKTGYKWIGKPGDKLDDMQNWEAPKSGTKAAKGRGIVGGEVKPAPEPEPE